MALLFDNLSLINLGANNGNYARNNGNSFEYTDVDVRSGGGEWSRTRGKRGRGSDHKGHGKGHYGKRP